MVPAVVFHAAGTPDQRYERTRPVPESKRHFERTGVSATSTVERRASTGRRRSESPAARSHLSLSELSPAPAPARALSPHPSRAHERPSSAVPHGLGHKRKVATTDTYDDSGMRVVAEKPRGLGYAPPPKQTEQAHRKKLFQSATSGPNERQLAAMSTVKRRGPPPSDKYLLTANDNLPREEYTRRVAQTLPARSSSPFRGLSNRCSSPNILAWE